jgi:hypothetical protein
MSNEAIRIRLQELKAKLCCIADSTQSTNDLLTSIDLKLAPVQRRPGVLSTDTNGATSSGWYSFSIANVGSSAGIVNGQSIPAGTVLNFDGGTLNNTLDSLPYDASGTTFIITYIG